MHLSYNGPSKRLEIRSCKGYQAGITWLNALCIEQNHSTQFILSKASSIQISLYQEKFASNDFKKVPIALTSSILMLQISQQGKRNITEALYGN